MAASDESTLQLVSRDLVGAQGACFAAVAHRPRYWFNRVLTPAERAVGGGNQLIGLLAVGDRWLVL